MTAPVAVEVEEPLGPGVDFASCPPYGLVGQRARGGTLWLGFDRAALVDSDGGGGRRVPVIVALPVSTFRGARLDVELTGGWVVDGRAVLNARLRGGVAVPTHLARVAGRVPEGSRWIDASAAARLATDAHRRYRERRSHARITGGRAWDAVSGLTPGAARASTPHSHAEYAVERLAPRFVRAMAGLLDDDERVLYWIERPARLEVSLLRRLHGPVDRRAAVLLLTDREVLWLIDHSQPDIYGSDHGVDVALMPVERLLAVHRGQSLDGVELRLETAGGRRSFRLPVELAEEVAVMHRLLERFVPRPANAVPRRTYAVEALPPEVEAADRFHDEDAAARMVEAAYRGGPLLGLLYSPRRPGQRSPASLILRPEGLELMTGDRVRRLRLPEVVSLTVVLSPLAGGVGAEPGLRMPYPAALMDRAAAFVRLARRVLAGA